MTVVAYSKMLLVALEAAEQLSREGVDVEVIDPRTLKPLNLETIVASVKKTGRLVIVEEGWRFCGLGTGCRKYLQRGVRLFDGYRSGHRRKRADPGTADPLKMLRFQTWRVWLPLSTQSVVSHEAWLPKRAGSWSSKTVGFVEEDTWLARVVMPKLTDTMEEGVLLAWKKHEGDRVQAGEVIAEIETDKAVMDLEAFAPASLENCSCVMAKRCSPES